MERRPIGREAVARYIDTALAWREAGTAVPFATVRIADGVGSGLDALFRHRELGVARGHERHGRSYPDVCEIGYTWLTRDAIRTAANTEAKLLMLTYAFEIWQVLRVCLHTDARNQRSQAAIERIGGKFEGVLRAHRWPRTSTPRDSYRYSIVAADWPEANRSSTTTQTLVSKQVSAVRNAAAPQRLKPDT
jgi:RimJ/RimL family protein N-acetyltransferase